MKRPLQTVAGGPILRAGRRAQVAGGLVERRAPLRILHGGSPFPPAVTDDAALLEDFEDFLAPLDRSDGYAAKAPDPGFRERLRSRLWRTFVFWQLRGRPSETH